jgi:hypothetical protein
MKAALEALITKRIHTENYTMEKGITVLHVTIDAVNPDFTIFGHHSANIFFHHLLLINPTAVEIRRTNAEQDESEAFYVWELKENWKDIKAEYDKAIPQKQGVE